LVHVAASCAAAAAASPRAELAAPIGFTSTFLSLLAAAAWWWP